MSDIDSSPVRRLHLDGSLSNSYHVDRNRRYPEPTVLSCGYQKCRPSYRVRRVKFSPYCVEYVVRGRDYIVVEGRKQDVQAGSVFTYGPEPHDYGADPSDPMEKMHVAFSGSGSREWLLEPTGGITTSFGLTAPGEVADVFTRLLSEASSVRRNRREVLGSYLKILLLKLETLKAVQGKEGVGDGVYQAAKAAIESQFATLKTAGEVSSSLGVTMAHLCRVFKRHAGTSPHDFLLQLKLNHAAEQLATTSRSIKEIAYELKFCDPYHFSRSFKKRFGKSPRLFRNEGL